MGCKPAAVVPTFERCLRDVYADSWEDFCTSPCAGAFLKLVPWSTWALTASRCNKLDRHRVRACAVAAGCFDDFVLLSFQLTSKDVNGFDILQFGQPCPKRRKRKSYIEIQILSKYNEQEWWDHRQVMSGISFHGIWHFLTLNATHKVMVYVCLL